MEPESDIMTENSKNKIASLIYLFFMEIPPIIKEETTEYKIHYSIAAIRDWSENVSKT